MNRRVVLLLLCVWPMLLTAQETSSLSHGEGQEVRPEGQASVYETLVRKAFDALAQDSLSQAETLLRQAMQDSPSHKSNYLLFRYLGQICERQGREGDALENYTAALNLNAQNTELRLDRAALLYNMGNEARALSDYNDVLDIEPENMEALLMRAHIYANQRDNKRARQDYDAILRMDPLNERAYIGLILLNDNDNRPREAMEQINSLIAVYPKHAILYAIRGGMEQRRRQYELANRDLTQAIEMEPENADFYVSRATLYLEMGKKKQARLDTQMAVKYGADPKEMAALLK